MITSIPFLQVRLPESSDFLNLKEMVDNDGGWVLDYEHTDVKIWSRTVDNSSIKMVKVWAVYSRVTSKDLYNTIMDPLYRREWDTNMVVSYEVGYLTTNSTITYYGASCPFIKKRDVVLQHSWHDTGLEQFVINRSVCHKDHPPRPGFIRAITYFTGYYIKTLPNNGSEVCFISQTDPQGIIPAWIVNKCTTIFAPRIVRNLGKAAVGYSTWKIQNDPNNFPWVYPEQIKTQNIPITDCVPSEEEKGSSFYLNLLNKLQNTLESETSVHLSVSNEESHKIQSSHKVTKEKSQTNVESKKRKKKCKKIARMIIVQKNQKKSAGLNIKRQGYNQSQELS